MVLLVQTILTLPLIVKMGGGFRGLQHCQLDIHPGKVNEGLSYELEPL